MPDNNDNHSIRLTINPKVIMLWLGLMSAIGSAAWGAIETAIWVDSRYLKVADYKTIEKQKRIKFLEDTIFELNFKKQNNTITDLEKALLERYRDELKLLRTN